MRRPGAEAADAVFLKGCLFSCLLSCQAPTQVRVIVTTDVACSSSPVSGIAVGTLAAVEGKPLSATSARCEGSGDVGTLVVVPSGASDDELAIRVVQASGGGRAEDCAPPLYQGCIVARRVLRYLPHRSVDLDVPMRLSCVDVPCDASQTCVDGRCVPASLVGRDCVERGRCGEADLGDLSQPSAHDPERGLLASTDFASCAVTNATVSCWGSNHQAELGRGTVSDFELPGPTVPAFSGTGLAGHDALFCALRPAAVPACWGSSNAFEGFAGNLWSPAPVDALAGAIELAVGRSHCCFRTQADIQCFGDNTRGQLGRSGPSGSSTVALPAGTLSQLVGSREATAALLADGRIYGWGQSQFEQFGKPTSGESVFTPTLIAWPVDQPARVLAAFTTHLCAILADATVACWGHNDSGKAGGDNPNGAPYAPARVRGESATPLGQVTAVAVGTSSSCAVSAGKVYCWGANSSGQLGVPSSSLTFSARALIVSGLPPAVEAVTLGDSHACARTRSGEVWCWGDNRSGQVGVAPDAGTSSPTPRRVL